MSYASRIRICAAISILVLAGCPSPVTPPPTPQVVATPLISPTTGSSIQRDSAQIAIMCTTPGASIFYTTDGSVPSASSTPYTTAVPIAPFAVVGASLRIKAIALLGGSTDSEVAEAAYNVIDTQGPIPVVTGPAAVNAPFDITITFNEDVTGFTDPAADLTVTNGNASPLLGGPRIFYTHITPTGAAAETVTVTIPAGVCADAYASPSSACAAPLSVIFDPTAPVGVISSTATSPTGLNPIPVTIDFGKSVQGFDAADIRAGNGSVSGPVAGGPQVYTASILPSGQGAVTVDIPSGACNAATPPYTASLVSTQFSIMYDSIGPDVIVNQASGQNDPTNSAINFTVTFTEPVSDFNGGCVALSGSAGPTTAFVTGSGTTYNVVVSGMTADGTVIAALNAGVCHDAAGNGNTASTSVDNTVTCDTIPPSVTINQAAGQVDPTNTSPINFTVVFSETVTDFVGADVTVSGTAGATTAVVTGSGTVYNAAISGMTADGTVSITVMGGNVHDAAGNANIDCTHTDNAVTYSTTGPSVTIDQAAGQADPTNTSPITFTVVFSEPVTDFTAADVALSGTAGASTAAVTGSGAAYTVTVNGMTGNGSVIAAIPAGAVHDAVGNASTASTSTDNTVTYDIVGPSVTVNQAASQADPTNTPPITFTVVFSEPVADFTSGDVALTGTAGATTAVVTGSGTTYSVAVSGMTADGTVMATVAAGAAHDAAGNDSAACAHTDNMVTLDTTAPTVTINQTAAQADPTNTSPIRFTVAFSEPVMDFFTGNVTLSGTANPGIGSVTGSGASYTVAVSGMTANGTVIAQILAGVAHDAAGNGCTASTSADNQVIYDTIGPSVTITQAAAQEDPTKTTPIGFTVVFSETVTDFSTGDVSLAGTARPSLAIVTGSGTTYDIAVDGMTANGTVVANLAAGIAHDAAGNPSFASTSTDNTVTYDTVGPSVTINQAAAQTDPTNASSINFTVVFSDSVSDFATGAVTLAGTAGATTAVVTGSGTTYNVAVSGMTANGTVIAMLLSNVAHDTAGNGNYSSTSTDNTVTFYNAAAMLGTWSGSTAESFSVPAAAGSHRILLVTANASGGAPASTVTGVTYGGQALTKISERTYNGVSPTVTNSLWYLNEAGISGAVGTTLQITWSSAPTAQQNWARFISTVNQTTPIANVQGGDSTTTGVSAPAVSYAPGNIGFAVVSSITTAEGTDTVSGVTLDQQESASPTFEAVVGDLQCTTTGNFTPSYTISTATKQTLQAFVVQGY